MATLNYAFKELSCKIVYYGCGLCGKTTNLEHIHKTVPGKFRGELVSLATEQDRTLFFDFLPLDLGEVRNFKTKFQLYTVPGQVYYNATRKLVLRGVDGIVFVVDSSRDRVQENKDSLDNLAQNLQEYGYHLKNGPDDRDGVPWVMQYNKRDLPDIVSIEELEGTLNSYRAPYMEAVAFKGTGVKETLKAISTLVIKKLNSDGGENSLPKPAAKPAAAAAAKASAAAEDDEYGALDEKEEAAEEARAAAAPQKSSQPKAAAGPKPVTAAAPKSAPKAAPAAEASAPAGLSLSITQVGDATWRGMKTGTADLTISNVVGGAKEEFQLTGVVSFLLGIKRSFAEKLKFTGTGDASYQGASVKVHNFDCSGVANPPGLSVRVVDGDLKKLFVSYQGTGGEVVISPKGLPPLG